MRVVLAACAALIVSAGFVWAQDKPAPTPEEQALIQAVMALQKAASAECDALPSVKQYAAIVGKANDAFAKSGRRVDWRTGQVSPVPPKEGAK